MNDKSRVGPNGPGTLVKHLLGRGVHPASLLIGLSIIMLAVRDWIALDHRLPLGAAGDMYVVRANKLSGWVLMGSFLGQWSWSWFWVGVFWEWLPALLFGAGLWLWIRSAHRLPEGRLRLLAALPHGVQPWAGFFWLLGVASVISLFCFQAIPHVQDSIAQHFQAQIFARGQPYAAAPPHGMFFLNEFLVQDNGRWYAQYPPIQAAFLAVGLLAGVPWLVNPLLGALSGVFIYLAARRAYGRSTAALAMALFCVSPFVWFMSGERMNHTGALFWISLALFLLSPVLARKPAAVPPPRLILGGLALGMAMATRPLCGLAVAVPLLLVLLCLRPQSRASPNLQVAFCNSQFAIPLVVGMTVGFLPFLLFNLATTGSALRSGYEVQWGSSGWGFGQAQWGSPHTVVRGLFQLASNWDAAARYLFEWPLPSLLPLVGLLCLRRWTRMDIALVGMLASLSLAYIPYFFQDLCLGPRFLYAGTPAFVILSARGIRAAGLGWAQRRGWPHRRGIDTLTAAAAVCTLVGLGANLPVLVRQYSSSFWGTSTVLVDAVRAQDIHHAVVFIRDHNRARLAELRLNGVSWRVAHGAVETLDEGWIDRQIGEVGSLPQEARARELERRLQAAVVNPALAPRRTHVPWIDYKGYSSNLTFGFWANTPWPERQDVIYALHLGERNRQLLRTYPGRRAWLYDYDPVTRVFRLHPLADGAVE
jgi:dolichyl-phosphate-mannose-protein mannosyltransferase